MHNQSIQYRVIPFTQEGVTYKLIPFSLDKALEPRNKVVTRGTETEVEWKFFESNKSQPIVYAYKDDVLSVDRNGSYHSHLVSSLPKEVSPLDLVILEPTDKYAHSSGYQR